MALANCRRCGGLYNKVSIDICPACTKEEERLLRETQQYLREHKLATVAQVVEDLDIRCELVDKWCKEKRINLVHEEDFIAIRRCQYCGREIAPSQGFTCKTCQIKRLGLVKTTTPETPEADPNRKKAGGMYYHKSK
ncbi:MAG: hypothetical protein ACOX5R_08525 [bacterium]